MAERCDIISQHRYDGKPGRCRCHTSMKTAGVRLSSPTGLHTAVCCSNHQKVLWHGKEVTDIRGYIWSRPDQGAYVCRFIDSTTVAYFTGPNGNHVSIDTANIIHITDKIQYTTVCVTKGRETYRVVVCEKPSQIRKVRTDAHKEAADA